MRTIGLALSLLLWAGCSSGAAAQNDLSMAAQGDAATTCGAPGQACCTNNDCRNGGCCVFDVCVASGSKCQTSSMLVRPGQSDDLTCNGGGCETIGYQCGKKNLPCCANFIGTQVCTDRNVTCQQNQCL